MSEISQHQHVFRIQKPNAAGAQQPRTSIKRNRPTVSCLPCRSRKLKCDRSSPCNTCSKRGEASSCSYAVATPQAGTSRREKQSTGLPKTSEAQARLQKLEAMVSELLQSNNVVSPSSAEIVTPPEDTLHQSPGQQSDSDNPVHNGHMDLKGDEKNYLGATHWSSILDNIRELQDFLGSPVDVTEAPGLHSADLMIPLSKSFSMQDVYSGLPPKAGADRLLSVYFKSKFYWLPIIHTVRFQREYEKFWDDPSSMSFIWISILFSVLCLGSNISSRSGNDSIAASDSAALPKYLTAAGHAFVTGQYLKAKPYSVEALVLYAYCTYLHKPDASTDAWMLIGLSARLAMKMGYHRDSRHLSGISPFDGEMRRRTFYTINNFDVLLSIQAGLPPIIHDGEYDAEPPSNLLDTDFDEDCTSLPQSRPDTDPTPILYHCFKSRVTTVLRRIAHHALSLREPSYENTMRLDAELQALYRDIPPSLKLRPLSSSITDDSCLIMNRTNTDLKYHISICILHRRYLMHERANPAYEYSRNICISSAIHVLDHQAELYAASQPGGLLHSDRWMQSSLALHDFLLAAMILSLDMYESSRSPTIDANTQSERLGRLKRSHEIWSSRKDHSLDARRASDVLEVMLTKISNPKVPLRKELKTSQSESDRSGQGILDSSDTTSEQTGNCIQLDTPLSWNTTSNPPATFTTEFDDHADSHVTSSVMDVDNIFENIDNFDWSYVDQYLFGRSDSSDNFQDWSIFDDMGTNGTT